MKDLPVDAGMIGIVPLAAVQRAGDGWPEGGEVVKVQGGHYLNLHYNNGRITISADLNGAIPVLEDTDFWVGDLCYVLENNIPFDDRDWTKAADPEPGYWAACLRTFETPREGVWFCRAFPIAEGVAGLVSRTKWGDGCYPAYARMEGEYTVCVVVETGDTYEDEEE